MVEKVSGGGLIEVPEGKVVLVKTEEVAEFVQVGGANLLTKDIRVALGKIPKILEVENDAGRGVGGDRVSFQATGAFEETEQIRFKTLVEDRGIRNVLIEGDNGFRGTTQLGG